MDGEMRLILKLGRLLRELEADKHWEQAWRVRAWMKECQERIRHLEEKKSLTN